MAELKSTLLHFASGVLRARGAVRLRPSYFVHRAQRRVHDMMIRCVPTSRRGRWSSAGAVWSIRGCELCDIDPELHAGFAFGFGIELPGDGQVRDPRHPHDVRERPAVPQAALSVTHFEGDEPMSTMPLLLSSPSHKLRDR